MQKVKIIFTLLVVLCVSFIAGCSKEDSANAPNISYSHLPPKQKGIAKLPPVPLVYQNQTKVLVIALNTDNPAEASVQNILSGLDAILLYDTDIEENVPQKQSHYHYFSSQSILAKLENIHQGYIDYLDSSFAHLKILIFSSDGQRKIIPIYQAGVRAIYFDISNFKSMPENANNFGITHNQVIMSDGSKRALSTLLINKNYLQGTTEIDQLVVTPTIPSQ